MARAAFRWFGDHVLRIWWVRYLLIPAIQGGPAALVALDISLGHKTIEGYNTAFPVFAAAIWSGVFSALIAGIDRILAFSVERLKRERDDLLRLIGHVRGIVGFKSRRFHETGARLRDPVDASSAFFAITQPDAQIREIVRAIHDFFKANSDAGEVIKVSLMEWAIDEAHLAFLAFFPDAEAPRANARLFNNNSTIAGRAYFDNNLIVCEDLEGDKGYQQFASHDTGSMFAYPVYDPEKLRVALIVNVVSDRIRRFKSKDRYVLSIPMQVFGERLLLEYRLRDLLRRALPSKEAGHGGRSKDESA